MLCFSSYRGKLAQRSLVTQRKFVTSPNEFFDILCNDAYEVHDVLPVNDDCMFMSFKPVINFDSPPKNTNPLIASYVTTYARLELYNHLERLDRRVLYCDTDSIVYEHNENQYNPPLGEFVGELTDELEGCDILEFVSNGAKNYGYKRSDDEKCIKVKGFTLSHSASEVITFDKMKEVALSREGVSLQVKGDTTIRRDIKRRRVVTVPLSKTYRSTFDKRIKEGNYSVPYGFYL